MFLHPFSFWDGIMIDTKNKKLIDDYLKQDPLKPAASFPIYEKWIAKKAYSISMLHKGSLTVSVDVIEEYIKSLPSVDKKRKELAEKESLKESKKKATPAPATPAESEPQSMYDDYGDINQPTSLAQIINAYEESKKLKESLGGKVSVELSKEANKQIFDLLSDRELDSKFQDNLIKQLTKVLKDSDKELSESIKKLGLSDWDLKQTIMDAVMQAQIGQKTSLEIAEEAIRSSESQFKDQQKILDKAIMNIGPEAMKITRELFRNKYVSEEKRNDAITQLISTSLSSIEGITDQNRRFLEQAMPDLLKEQFKMVTPIQRMFGTIEDFYSTKIGRYLKEGLEPIVDIFRSELRTILGPLDSYFNAIGGIFKSVHGFFADTETKEELQIKATEGIGLKISSTSKLIVDTLKRGFREISNRTSDIISLDEERLAFDRENELEGDRERKTDWKKLILDVLVSLVGMAAGAVAGMVALQFKPFIWVTKTLTQSIWGVVSKFEIVKKTISTISTFFSGIATKLSALPKVGGIFANLIKWGSDIGGTLSKVLTWFKGLSRFVGIFVKTFTFGLSKLAVPLQVIVSVIDFFKGWSKSTKDTLVGKLGDALRAVIEGFFKIPLTVIGWVFDKIFGTKGSGKKMMDALIWVFDKLWGIVEWVSNKVTTSISFITKNWYKLNPIYWIYKGLFLIGEKLWKAFTDTDVAKLAKEFFIDPIVELFGKIKEAILGVWKNVKGSKLNPVNWFSGDKGTEGKPIDITKDIESNLAPEITASKINSNMISLVEEIPEAGSVKVVNTNGTITHMTMRDYEDYMKLPSTHPLSEMDLSPEDQFASAQLSTAGQQLSISSDIKNVNEKMVKGIEKSGKESNKPTTIPYPSQQPYVEPPIDIETISILFFNKTWGIT